MFSASDSSMVGHGFRPARHPAGRSASGWAAVTLAFVLATGSLAFGAQAPAEPDESFPTLTLKDGRVLENAVLKAFNSSSVFVKCSQGLLQVGYEEFPDALQPKLQSARTVALAAAAGKTAGPTLAERENALRHAVQDEQEREKLAAKEKKAQSELLAKIDKAVRTRAETYLRTEATALSGHLAIHKIVIVTDPPVPTDGWTGRYTVKGKCQLEFLDRFGTRLIPSQGRAAFVATVELTPSGTIEVSKIERELID